MNQRTSRTLLAVAVVVASPASSFRDLRSLMVPFRLVFIYFFGRRV